MGTGLIAYSTRTNVTKSFLKHGKLIPEERLPPMIVGALVLPIGLFWFGWYERRLHTTSISASDTRQDFQPQHYLGTTGSRHGFHWHGKSGYFLAGHELHH